MRLRNAALRFEPDPQLLTRIGRQRFLANRSSSARPQSQEGLGASRWQACAASPFPPASPTERGPSLWQGDVRPGDVLITDMTLNPRTRPLLARE